MENNFQIFVSPKAVEQINLQLSKRKTPDASIRLGVRGAGCSGFTYQIQFEDEEPKEKDLLFNIDNVRVIVDKKSILYLNGTTLDWEKTLLKQGFKFVNPNEKSSCGCGSSFSV